MITSEEEVMPRSTSTDRSERVLIHAPFGRDGSLIQHELLGAGFSALVCKSVAGVCECVREGAGAALIADEALTPPAVQQLAGELINQPPWSDFPLVVMTSGGATTISSRQRTRLLNPLTNVTLLERPLRPETLTSSIRAALRARRRQYELCHLLSELANNNDELKRTNQELTRVNRELEEFAYVASHDLQEPLRMVNIYTQLMIRKVGPEDENVNQYANFVKQGVTRMERLIRDLLTFSRTVHTEARTGEPADLSASLAQAVAVLQSRIDENAAIIHAEKLPVVRGDVRQLAQVFQNLISNSIKYRQADLTPEITISAERSNGEWVTSVRDNGIGFEQQYADRIFGLFKRLHKDEYPGTGLGLAICRRIVERYEGRMWATSETGQGSSFYFALPAV